MSTQGIKLGRSAARDVGARDGVLEKIANFCLEVHMRPQMTTLPEILSRHHLRRMVWPATIVGMTVASRHHHASTILVADLKMGKSRCQKKYFIESITTKSNCKERIHKQNEQKIERKSRGEAATSSWSLALVAAGVEGSHRRDVRVRGQPRARRHRRCGPMNHRKRGEVGEETKPEARGEQPSATARPHR